MRILVYTPTNARAVDLQSVMELFSGMGHEVHLLSQLPEGPLHKNVKQYGVQTHSCIIKHTGIFFYYKHAKFLARFIRMHKIDMVFAHLQGAGLAAGIARRLTRFAFFYVRHNTDEHILQHSKNAAFINSLTNKLAKKIIAPSEKVYRYLIINEKISPSKILRINYGYNFSQYLQTDKTGIAIDIRRQFECKMLVASVARLIPVKRHLLMFEIIKRLRDKNFDIKMICLSDGPFRRALQDYIDENGLQDNIFLLGSKNNVFDYLEASDIFLHLSATEASNSAVKEAGYCKKLAVVCKNVGDFDDYIVDDVNGYILNKENPVPEGEKVLTDLYSNPDKIKQLGDAMQKKILTEFDIQRVKDKYAELLTF